MYHPTAKVYFAGAGLMDLGLLNAGLDIQQSLELDQTCAETLRSNFSHKVVCQDIKSQEVLNQEPSDVIVGAYPCNHYSNISDIHGTRTGDELFLHFFRHIALEQPEAYVVENVPGMRKFRVVMEAMTRLPDYYVNVFCPVDSLNWLPQKRQRLVIIGTKRNNWLTPPTPNRQVRLKDILENDPEISIPKSVHKRMNGVYRDRPIISDPEVPGAYAPTAVAHYAKDRSTRLVRDHRSPVGVRPYTTREYARLMGVPDSFSFAGSPNQIYHQVGNGVAVPMAEWVGRQLVNYFNYESASTHV